MSRIKPKALNVPTPEEPIELRALWSLFMETGVQDLSPDACSVHSFILKVAFCWREASNPHGWGFCPTRSVVTR